MEPPLSQLFATERHRLRAGHVGHSVPLASEIDLDDRGLEPLMITSTRGSFLQSRISRHGYLRFGFSECPLDGEGALVLALHAQLVRLAHSNGWGCVSESPEAAVTKMRDNGVTPFHLAAGPWIEMDEVGGARVLDVGLPRGMAVLFTSPADAGLHTRIGNYVGVVAYRADRSLVAVVPA